MTRLLLLVLTVSMSAVGISSAYSNEDVPQIGVLLPEKTSGRAVVSRGFYGAYGWRSGSTRLESSSLAIGRTPYGSYSGSSSYGGSGGYGSYGGYSSGGGWSGK